MSNFPSQSNPQGEADRVTRRRRLWDPATQRNRIVASRARARARCQLPGVNIQTEVKQAVAEFNASPTVKSHDEPNNSRHATHFVKSYERTLIARRKANQQRMAAKRAQETTEQRLERLRKNRDRQRAARLRRSMGIGAGRITAGGERTGRVTQVDSAGVVVSSTGANQLLKQAGIAGQSAQHEVSSVDMHGPPSTGSVDTASIVEQGHSGSKKTLKSVQKRNYGKK